MRQRGIVDAMHQVIETTLFKLRGVSLEAFLEANVELSAWLRKQPGFHWRRLSAHSDGTIVDVLLWETMEDGEAAAAGVMSEMGHSPVHAMIDQRTVSWRLARVAQLTESSAPATRR